MSIVTTHVVSVSFPKPTLDGVNWYSHPEVDIGGDRPTDFVKKLKRSIDITVADAEHDGTDNYAEYEVWAEYSDVAKARACDKELQHLAKCYAIDCAAWVSEELARRAKEDADFLNS